MTECGKNYKHDPHLYEEDDRKYICDGTFMEDKR